MRYKYISIPFILGILCFVIYRVVSWFPTENNTVIFLNFLIPIGFILFGAGLLLIFIKMIFIAKIN
ncbi:MAG: group-specific protein [Tenericutes bacterium HGW-Tenericutes-1]|jgi:hypothetical protein|nr:MAG: group-specific protein [Tenericutes bacterium HGW-Tenericutes-1]